MSKGKQEPVRDYFGTAILPGDRIIKEESWSWKKGSRYWFYVIAVDGDDLWMSRLSFQGAHTYADYDPRHRKTHRTKRGVARHFLNHRYREDGAKNGVYRIVSRHIRKHKKPNPARLFIDHHWRARRNVGQVDRCCRLGG